MDLEQIKTLYPWKKEFLKQYTPVDNLMVFRVKADKNQLWALMADTNRLNRSAGMGKRVEEEIEGRRIVHDHLLGFKQVWEELPWFWVVGSFISIERRFIHAFAYHCKVVYHLEQVNDEVEVSIYFSYLPKNFVFRVIYQIGMKQIANKMKATILAIAEDLRAAKSNGSVPKYYQQNRPYAFSEFTQRKLAKIESEMLKENVRPETIAKLFEYLKNADELDLFRVRPLLLAREWNMETKEVLKGFLYGTKYALFNISWDVICPHCRGTREKAKNLSELMKSGHCDACDMDFTTDMEESIEVTFQPHPSIREAKEVLYCSADASKKSHIKIQYRLKAGKKLEVNIPLAEGPHRLRIINGQTCENFKVEKNQSGKAFVWDGNKFTQKAHYDGDNNIVITNQSASPLSFLMEEVWWGREALRPADIFSYKEFEAIFPKEAIKSGVQLNLGEQTILFTDIVGSTKFYEQSGDAVAFNHVLKHFEVVFGIVEKYQGVIPKTIGDAVMAAFKTPEDALLASFDIHNAFTGKNAEFPLRLRISIHSGSVMAISLKSGVDFFGKTVNFTAKLQACCEAGEIAISQSYINKLQGYNGNPRFSQYKTSGTKLKIAGRDIPESVTVIDTNTPTSAWDKKAVA